MFHKLHMSYVKGNLWVFTSEIYRHIKSGVLWEIALSNTYKQSAHQPPTRTAHKTNQLRCHIVSIYDGSLIVAADITIAFFNSEEMQTMLDMQNRYICIETHTINHIKSQALQLNNATSDASRPFNQLRLINTLWYSRTGWPHTVQKKLFKGESAHFRKSAIRHADCYSQRHSQFTPIRYLTPIKVVRDTPSHIWSRHRSLNIKGHAHLVILQ